MTNNWFGGPSTPFDPSTFNYEVDAQKLQRQRAAAQALQAFGAQSNQGQFIKSGDFTGFAGGNTAGSTIARVIASVLGGNVNSAADDKQTQLATNSQDALSWTMDPKNSPAGQRAAAAQAKSESDAELQREASRTIQGGERIDPNADQSTGVQTYRVETPTTTTSPMTRAAVKVLRSTKAASSSGAATPTGNAPSVAAIPASNVAPRQTQSVTGGPQSFGTDTKLSRMLAPPTKLPTGASGSLRPSDIAFAGKMFAGTSPTPVPAPVGNAPGKSQNVTGATVPVPSVPSIPPMPPQGQAPTPQPLPAASQSPAPMPQAPQPQMVDLPQQPTAPIGDPRSMIDQAVANAQPTSSEQIAHLQAIARTGPMGQQLSSAMMNSQFSREWGEVKNADGATVGVYNKRDPNQTIGFPGTNTGVKTMDAAMTLVKSTDYTNPDAMQRLNQNLVSIGQPPMTASQVAGMQLSASERVNHTMTLNKAQGEIANDIVTSRNNISSTQKAIDDARTMISLAAIVGSRYPAVSSISQLWSQYGKRDPEVDQLHQLYSQNTIAAVREALHGDGRLNQQEYTAFQAATPNMQTNPAAVARLVGPSIQLMLSKIENENAILNERTHRYKKMGGDPNTFGQDPAGPKNSSQSGASTGRAPGNYNF